MCSPISMAIKREGRGMWTGHQRSWSKTPEKLVQEKKKNFTNSLKIHSSPQSSKESSQKQQIFTLNSFENKLIPPPPQCMMQAQEQNESFSAPVFSLPRLHFMHTPAWCRCDFYPDRYWSSVLLLRNTLSNFEVKKHPSIPSKCFYVTYKCKVT